jgi:predicted ATPase
VLPDLSDIEIKELPHNRFLYLQARFASGLTVPQWLLSDGTLRLVALTLLPYIAEQESVWLIEEPENGIHPTAIEEVFKALSPPNQGQILVATHSPMFLSLIGKGDLHFLLCFARSKNGSTDIVRGDQHPQLRRWKGEVNLSVYFAGGVLA